MTIALGKVENGKVVFDTPNHWPNGFPVKVEPAVEDNHNGIREEDWPTTKEGIAALLERMEEVEPFEWTEEERAEFHKAMQEQKAFELSKWEERSKKIESLFE